MNATCPILSRLTGKLSVVSATFLLTLYKTYKRTNVETVQETGRGMQEEEMKSKKRKISDGVMRWSNS